MPGHDGLRFHDDQRGAPVGPQPGEPSPAEPASRGALEHVELMTQGKHRCLQSGAGSKPGTEGGELRRAGRYAWEGELNHGSRQHKRFQCE